MQKGPGPRQMGGLLARWFSSKVCVRSSRLLLSRTEFWRIYKTALVKALRNAPGRVYRKHLKLWINTRPSNMNNTHKLRDTKSAEAARTHQARHISVKAGAMISDAARRRASEVTRVPGIPRTRDWRSRGLMRKPPTLRRVLPQRRPHQ